MQAFSVRFVTASISFETRKRGIDRRRALADFPRVNSAKKQRVLLGMSGGVDSSVAGYLLREQGYEVIGVTMKVWPQDCISRAEDKCCGPQAVADARGVAHALGFPHYVVDEADQFEKLVINYFSSEYQAGRTPNPCVMCNEKLKFGNLWQKAEALACDFIATGHYAIIDHSAVKGGGYSAGAVLRKGIDPRKDQSYFLFSLRQEQLERALTPLGSMSKSEIRAIARKIGLKVADKPDSQEICFVPGRDYKAFLRSHLGENQFHRGGIYDLDGNFIAAHDGIEMFTIVQRKGLPGGSAQPRYVVDLDPETNRVIVGQAEDLLVEEFEIDRVNWIAVAGLDKAGPRSATAAGTAREVTVKIRYNHPGARATVVPLEDHRARVSLHEPQKAVTPGQAAVLYDDDVVLGGGWICRQAALMVA
ncbi:MAG: tRNA 2-thiouridine(34) synthase MnmA [Verrucomicrobia bacterium]|nr:MAG: tRNA 2-thiouridine(34) synthase MnmA [Verrucomicrobiota bacterium]